MDVLLIHGYNVTSTKTYGVLPKRLQAEGHTVKNVYLSKYVTLDDDLTLSDVVRAFQAALVDLYGDRLDEQSFACITHSTGGVVLRSWVDSYYSMRRRALPLTHLILLAPPNNGSRLAGLGKSKLSRMRAILGVEPGLKILNDLELGSRFQWDLNTVWMKRKWHKSPGFYTFVITGQWIDKKLWDVLVPATFERGSDGVVRAASANLNMQKFTFTLAGKIFKEEMQGIPYLIAPKTAHSDDEFGVMAGIPLKGESAVFSAINTALRVADARSYKATEADFALRTAQLQRDEPFYDKSPLSRYCQVLFRVTDNSGNRLDDYAIELIDASGRGDQLPSGFFGHQHRNEVTPERFMFYLNYDALARVPGGKIGFRIHAATGTALVTYPVFEYMGNVSDVSRFLHPNQTTLVDVTLNRRLNKGIFRLTNDHAYQKIDGKPSDAWIE